MENVEDAYPLTSTQHGMLVHAVVSDHEGAYLEQVHARLEGPVDPNSFRSAWSMLQARHPVLRTGFLWEDLDEALQVVFDEVELSWVEEDWRGSDEASRLRAYLEADRARGFDLAEAPLTRFLLARVDETTWRWVWSFHHLILDGWSLVRLLDEAAELHDALLRGKGGEAPAAPLSFRDYVDHVQGAAPEAERFWRKALADLEPPPRIELHGEASDREFVHQERTLDPLATEALRSYARTERLTLNTLVHGAWGLVLGGRTGQREALFGTTVVARPPALPGADTVIGCCLATLPLRLRWSHETSTTAFLRDLQSRHGELRDAPPAGLGQIRSWSPLSGDRKLVDSLLVFESSQGDLDALATRAGLRMREIDILEESNFPLVALAYPSGTGLRLRLLGQSGRYSAEALERWMDDWIHVLSSLPATRGPVVDLETSAPAHRERVRSWERGAAPESPALSTLETIRACFRDHAHDTALIDAEGPMSYGELGARVDGLAARLTSRGVQPGDRVGVCIARSSDLIVGILGILRAGAAYVPLDPTYPAGRLGMMIEDAELKRVVVDAQTSTDLGEAVRIQVRGASPHPVPEGSPSPQDPAYVIFTSGSTGRPKGVEVRHRHLDASTQARLQFYDEPVGRFLLLSSASFDSSVVGIFWTLATGGALVLPRDGEERDVEALAELVRRHHVTHTLCLPSVLGALVEHAPPGALSSLRVAIGAGEVMTPGLAQEALRRLPEVRLFNEYGPTEATVWTTVEALEEHARDSVPIGRPVPGMDLRVLDPFGRRTPIGVAGELYIGGPQVVDGYLDRPGDLAPKSFISDPEQPGRQLYRSGDRVAWRPDGRLVFLGRVDEQVKVRGFRVELGEVEKALRDTIGVREAAVVAAPHIPVGLLQASLERLSPDAQTTLLEELQ